MGGDDGLFSLLKAKDIYSGRDAPVTTYKPEPFRVLNSGIRPKDIRSSSRRRTST